MKQENERKNKELSEMMEAQKKEIENMKKMKE
jgi:hypothetical protein